METRECDIREALLTHQAQEDKQRIEVLEAKASNLENLWFT